MFYAGETAFYISGTPWLDSKYDLGFQYRLSLIFGAKCYRFNLVIHYYMTGFIPRLVST